MPKVSVIIPVFGVEKLIERCARSLFEQTLDDIEFIFVDDCTKDNSFAVLSKVLKDYPTRKEQVVIIKHEVNKGLPTARKTGIEWATGEFIAHCDSDDWVEVSMYERMYLYAKETNSDFVYCDYYRSDGSNKIHFSALNGRLLTGPVWNKMVKTSLYKGNKIIYPIANKAEDGVLMIQLSYYAKKISKLNEYLYFYFYNPSSICGKKSEAASVKRFEEEKANTDLLVKFFQKNNIEKKYKVEIIRLKSLVRKNLLPLIRNPKYFKLWKSTYPEINHQILTNKGINIRNKISFLLTILHLYPLLKNKITDWA